MVGTIRRCLRLPMQQCMENNSVNSAKACITGQPSIQVVLLMKILFLKWEILQGFPLFCILKTKGGQKTMPSKAEFYRQMAEQVSTRLVGSWQEWTAFLTTAARL